MKIALYGDSLALPRQKIVDESERYISLIEDRLRGKEYRIKVQTIDRSKGGVIINELLEMLQHDLGYFTYPGDFAILHCGIVDCAPRPVDLKQRAFISKLPGFIKYRVINYLHKNRSRILRKGRSHVVTKPDSFEKYYLNLLELLGKNYRRVYVLTICPTNQAIEEHSPGFTKNINQYNSIIKNVVHSTGDPKIKLIDVHAYISQDLEHINNYILKEDGHHITPLTHAWIAKEILEHEEQVNNNLI